MIIIKINLTFIFSHAILNSGGGLPIYVRYVRARRKKIGIFLGNVILLIISFG